MFGTVCCCCGRQNAREGGEGPESFLASARPMSHTSRHSRPLTPHPLEMSVRAPPKRHPPSPHLSSLSSSPITSDTPRVAAASGELAQAEVRGLRRSGDLEDSERGCCLIGLGTAALLRA
eukprot:1774522-Rhodomonas_salina.3